MVRPEYIVVACIVISVGLVVGYIGYQKTQPTLVDKAIGFVEQLAQEQAPAGLKTDTTLGYLLMAGGTGLVVLGIALILNSRKAPGAGGR